MKQLINIKATLICLFALLGITAHADEVTYDFLNGVPSPWTSNLEPFGKEPASRGTQFMLNTNITLSGVSDVTKVVVTCSANSTDGQSAIEITVGGKSWGKESIAKETNVEKTFTGSAASGDIVITITRATKSVWIKQVVVSGKAPGTTGGETGGDTALDPNYKYDEPTVLTPTGELGNNTSYSFTQNNIKVSATTGGQTASYFGCNAGQSITFTAAKPIKAIVVDGYIKKDFEATATSGEPLWADASEEDTEGTPVFAIIDVDAPSVTITCLKQMRCYKAYVYFEENPDLGVEDELNYEFEPTTPTTFNIKFDDIEYTDYTDEIGTPYMDITLTNDDYELELAVLAPYHEGSIIAPGVYQINDTGDDNTVVASPGGDDYYDYPSFMAADFEFYAEYDDWFYNTAYYLASGTLTVSASEGGYQLEINAKTHFGSTIKATYTNGNFVSITSPKTTTPSLKKYLKGGKVYLKTRDKEYRLNGIEVK